MILDKINVETWANWSFYILGIVSRDDLSKLNVFRLFSNRLSIKHAYNKIDVCLLCMHFLNYYIKVGDSSL